MRGEPDVEETAALLVEIGESARAAVKDNAISNELRRSWTSSLKLAGLVIGVGIVLGLVILLLAQVSRLEVNKDGTQTIPPVVQMEEALRVCYDYNCPDGYGKRHSPIEAADDLTRCCEEAQCKCLHPWRSNQFWCSLHVKDSFCSFGANCVTVENWAYVTGRPSACQQRVRSHLFNPVDELKRPSKARLLTFYLYRAENVWAAPLENINAGNAAGMLFFLHNELKQLYDPVNAGLRIRRLKVQIRNTQPLLSLGYNFGPRMNFDVGVCNGAWSGPKGLSTAQACTPIFRTYGFSVGCSVAGDFSDSAYPDHPNWRPAYTPQNMYHNASGYNAYPGGAIWYSFVGGCPEQPFDQYGPLVSKCVTRSPGGRCYGIPTGEADCTYTMEDADAVPVKDLVEAWAAKEQQDPARFWDDLSDATASRKRVDTLLDIFRTKFGVEETLQPFCDFDPREPFWSADMLVPPYWRRLTPDGVAHLAYPNAAASADEETTSDMALHGPTLSTAIAARRERIRQGFSKVLAQPSTAPLLAFYVFAVDVGCKEEKLENAIAGDAAGAMFYIHDRLVDGGKELKEVCIRRFKVQVRATLPLAERGLLFGPRLHIQDGKCHGPDFGGILYNLRCGNIFDQYGFVVGCGGVGEFPDGNLFPSAAPSEDYTSSRGYASGDRQPIWYTFPGRLIEEASQEAIPGHGGSCDGEPDGTGSCTYTAQPAGFVFLHDVMKPHGSAFWDKKLDQTAGQQRVRKLLSVFRATFGEEDMRASVCEFNVSKPFFSTYIFGY